jgi:hypothetical protein
VSIACFFWLGKAVIFSSETAASIVIGSVRGHEYGGASRELIVDQQETNPMRFLLSRRAVLAAFLAVLIGPPAASADSWEKIGERSVRLIGDRDVIPVTALRGDFRRIKLRVTGNGVFINEVIVNFALGGADRLNVRSFIRAGGETRVLNLRGRDRVIRSVLMIYRSVPNSKGRATVKVYGR